MRFYLGTHETSWLERVDVPLFISHRRLAPRKRLPCARGAWALDSGGFTELSMFGEWKTGMSEYIEAVNRYIPEIGRMTWAAPQDWMCEPHIIEKTGLSVREHQERTVANFLELRDQGPFIPVLQGWTPDDYETCVALYADAGVDLTAEPVVGVGSVCRRQRDERDRLADQGPARRRDLLPRLWRQNRRAATRGPLSNVSRLACMVVSGSPRLASAGLCAQIVRELPSVRAPLEGSAVGVSGPT